MPGPASAANAPFANSAAYATASTIPDLEKRTGAMPPPQKGCPASVPAGWPVTRLDRSFFNVRGFGFVRVGVRYGVIRTFSRRPSAAPVAERLERRLCLSSPSLNLPFQAANFSARDPDFILQPASGTNQRKLLFSPPAEFEEVNTGDWVYEPAGQGHGWLSWPAPGSKQFTRVSPSGGALSACPPRASPSRFPSTTPGRTHRSPST